MNYLGGFYCLLVIFITNVYTYTQGGQECTLNVQCGIPAANIESLRSKAESISGKCFNNKCKCAENVGCSNCFVMTINNSTKVKRLDNLKEEVELCDIEWGLGICSADQDCNGGLCINNKCVCYYGWGCSDCSLGLNEDIRYGAKCGQYKVGFGICSQSSQCGHGKCTNGHCVCDSGYACSYCDKLRNDLLSGNDKCDCTNMKCMNGGTCKDGLCQCPKGYTGAQCQLNPCNILQCENGVCDPSIGKCKCNDGYAGEKCNFVATGGGECLTNKECGNYNGGECIDGYCKCYSGWTCPNCDRQGYNCTSKLLDLQGGGKCEVNADCGNYGPNYNKPTMTGGECVDGKCVCFKDQTCPNCDVKGTLSDLLESGGKCPDNANMYILTVISILLMIFMII